MFMSNCLQKMVFDLRDVGYVSRFQRFFGLQIVNEDGQVEDESVEVNDAGDEMNKVTRRSVHTSPKLSSSESKPSKPPSASQYRIGNYFWYYLFSFGSKLGYELFYSLSFSYCYWNVDSFVCRRLMLVWAILMYIGQAMKELIRWPRPSGPSVIILEPAYSFEYGMPSTHAILALSIPVNMFTIISSRYDFSAPLFTLIALAWCSLICCSRLYLGMHSVLDIVAGLALTGVFLVPLLPLVDSIDHFLMFRWCAPFVLLSVMVGLAAVYPATDLRSPSRGDTCVMIAATAGVYLSSWLHFHLGFMEVVRQQQLYTIHLPTADELPVLLLRTVLGLLVIAAFRFAGKTLITSVLKRVFALDTAPKANGQRPKPIVEVPTKLFTYLMVGLALGFVAPALFRILHIDRQSLSTEA